MSIVSGLRIRDRESLVKAGRERLATEGALSGESALDALATPPLAPCTASGAPKGVEGEGA